MKNKTLKELLSNLSDDADIYINVSEKGDLQAYEIESIEPWDDEKAICIIFPGELISG